MVTHSVYLRDSRIRRYSDYLAEEGHHVDIICLASEDGASQSSSERITVYPLSLTRMRRERLGLIADWFFVAISMFFKLSFLDLRKRYDLVHVHNMPDFLVFCGLIPRLRGCPVILNVHDPVPELARSKLGLSEHHPIIRGLLFLERISIAFSSHVITATPEFRNILIRRGVPSEKITVISNAANPLFFQAWDRSKELLTNNGRFVLLYVGTVAVRYGLDVCIRALPYLKEQIPQILLRIVPKIKKEGQALEDCLNLAVKLGVRDLVETTDPIPLEEMPRIMSEADIGVYPAYSDCHMDIALSLKIPEMAAVGLPIIATRLPVLVELFGDDGIAFIPPNDPQAMAWKVLDLYRAPEYADQLAEHAAKKSAALSWTEQRLVYRSVLESLLGHSITSGSISTALPEVSD